MFNKILNSKTILKHITIKIDNYELIRDDIISFDVQQSFDSFGLHGSLKIKDSYDINNNGLTLLNGDNKITVSMTDFLNNKSKRTYRIVNTVVNPAAERFKIYEFKFIDEVTWILKNTFLSRSFTSTPVQAFKEYITYLKIDDLFKLDKLKITYNKTGTIQSFVVPQNISVLDFFITKFKEENIRIWQDRYGVYIDELVPSSLTILTKNDGEDVLYTNSTLNNEYIYKIHDFQEVKNDTVQINEMLPLRKVYRHDVNKEIVDLTINLKDELSNFKLNTLDASNIQLTTGERYDTQSIYTTGNQTYDLFDVMMKNNQIHIAVPGDMLKSNVGNIAKIELKGNIAAVDSSTNGDVLTSGFYFMGDVKDLIIGDKLIQRLSLYRLDARKPR